MILADTSIWIDHFSHPNAIFAQQLRIKNILMHPFVVAELSLGSLRNRRQTIALLDRLPSAPLAQHSEVRLLVEERALYGRGIGFVDAHLLASTLLSPHCQLWTRDKRLRAVAEELDLAADQPKLLPS